MLKEDMHYKKIVDKKYKYEMMNFIRVDEVDGHLSRLNINEKDLEGYRKL